VLGVEGVLDRDALDSAVATVLERHANLRAGFVHEGVSQPVQIIPHDVRVPIADVDLSGLSGEEQAKRWAEWSDTDRTRRFDLSVPPLIRATLIRLRPTYHRLVLAFHHILLDACPCRF